MTHPALRDLYGQTYDVITRQTAGLTHEDSLLQPSHGGNCLNWVVGHIVVARANILALLGEQPAWGWRASRRYLPGAAPVVGGEDALRLERLLADLDRSQEQLVAALARLSSEELAAVEDGKPLGAHLACYHSQEAYRAGQTEQLRQLAVDPPGGAPFAAVKCDGDLAPLQSGEGWRDSG